MIDAKEHRKSRAGNQEQETKKQGTANQEHKKHKDSRLLLMQSQGLVYWGSGEGDESPCRLVAS